MVQQFTREALINSVRPRIRYGADSEPFGKAQDRLVEVYGGELYGIAVLLTVIRQGSPEFTEGLTMNGFEGGTIMAAHPEPVEACHEPGRMRQRRSLMPACI